MSCQQPRNLSLLIVAIGTAFPCGALAQIATDGTLGSAGTLAGPNYAVNASLGRQVGANLFHSFSAFNLTRLESATFSGPASIAHIINRVTGGTASSVDGLLRSTIAGANLYLINPNGILFGPNASLDLTGSFHATTANYIKLADGGRFDATNPGASVLTSAPPAAFGFLGPTPASIAVQGSSLSVPEGSSLSLVGGAVNLSDATLRTVAGDIRLVAMGGAGEVALNATGASLSGMTLAPVTIERSTLATESGTATAPGRIVVRGGQITVLDSILSSTNHEAADAPAVELAATGDLRISATNITNSTDGPGRGADLLMSGSSVTVEHNSQVLSQTSGSGASGNITLSGTGAVNVFAAAEDPNYTNVYALSSGAGPAGSISATADSVLVQSGNIFSLNLGSADAGPITLTGRNVSVTNGGWVFSQAYPGTTGRGADIELSGTGRAFVGGLDWGGNAASVFTEAYGSGNAGNIRMTAPEIGITGGSVFSKTYSAGNAGGMRFDGETVRFLGGNGAVAFVDTTSYSSGNGGDIEVRATREFEVSRADFPEGWTRLSTSAFSSGRGGSILVEAPSIKVADSGSIWTQATDSGNGGGITLRGGTVLVRDRGEVHTHTDGSGHAGNILISGRDIQAAGAIVTSYTSSTGNAGSIDFAAPEITTTGGYISSKTYDRGDAGSIRMTGDVIRLRGGNGIELQVESGASDFTTGNGGNVEIRATREFELNGSGPNVGWTRVAATTQGSGRGGDIIVEAPNILLDGAILFSRTRFGSGDQGGITLRADQIRLRNGGEIGSGTEGERKGSFILIEAQTLHASDYSRIFANTIGSGDAGRITINAQRVKLTGASSIEVNSGVGTGNAGDIVLNIGESLEISERNVFQSFFNFAPVESVWPGGLLSQATGSGDAGSIFVRAPSILLDDGRILTTALQSGQGGRVEIHADSLVMRNGAQVDARSATGSSGNAGSIDVAVAGRFEISGLSPIDGAFSGLYAQTQGSGRGGNIGISADALVLDRGLIRSSAGASGNAGTVRIRAGDVVLANGGWIDAGTTAGSSGAGGSIDVAATRSLVVGGIDRSPLVQSLFETQQLDIAPGTPGRAQGAFSSTISSNTAGAGAGGNVTLSAPQTSVVDGGHVSANSSGAGTAGNIFIQAPDWLKLSGGSVTTQAAISDGGNVTLNAPQITIDAGGQVNANSSGPGSAGNILVDAPQWLKVSGGSITTQAAIGDGGNIALKAAQITVDAGGQVSANSSGLGSAGNILIDAPQWLKLSDGSITTQAGIGAGGDVTLNAPQVTIGAGGSVSANSSGPGSAGNILIDASQRLNLSGGSITTQAAMGAGGNVALNAPQITIDAGGRVSANSSGAGNAGNILVDAPQWLKVSGGSITTQAASGDGGNIDIRAGNRVHLRNAEISTSVGSGEGSGGNIFIDPVFVILESSRIAANAFGGAGGNINIITDYFLASPDSVVEASSQLGVSGSVQIAGPRTDPSAALALLPGTFFDASALLRESCAGRAGPRASSLVGVGRGGLAAAPDGYSASRYFADTSLPLAQGGNPATFAESHATAATAQSVLLAACAH